MIRTLSLTKIATIRNKRKKKRKILFSNETNLKNKEKKTKMENLKYRAWDKEFKEMVVVNALVLDEQVIKATYKNGNVVKEDMKCYDIMQSSSLKDKNGNEISAGDILKVTDKHDKDSWLEVVSYSEEKAMFITDEINRDFKTPASPLYSLFDTDLFLVEIVGNVYEQPELVGDK
jgi:uncharacterized phage protein (TIGR01671 family)